MDSHSELIVEIIFRMPGTCRIEEEKRRQAIRLATHEPQHQTTQDAALQFLSATRSEKDGILQQPANWS